MHGLKSGSCRFWQRTDSPPNSNMLRAEIQRTLRRAPRQLRGLRLGLQTRRGSNHSAAHGSESNSRSNVFQIRRTSVCVSSRCWHALLLEMGNRCRKTTLVAHFRGSTLQFCAEPQDLRKSTRVCRVVIGWRPRWRIKFSLERFSDPSLIRLRPQPMPNSAWSPAYRLQTAALENQQNSPDLLELDYCSTHNEQWSVLALSNSRE